MGREIRRVPPNWEHPRNEKGRYRPMYDETFAEAALVWLRACEAWERGDHEDLLDDPTLKERYPFYWQWNGDPPSGDYYRPEFAEEPTWWQLYETVSEGTPVSPPFATADELIDWIAANGTGGVGAGSMPREAARRLVEGGYAPSMIVSDGRIVEEAGNPRT